MRATLQKKALASLATGTLFLGAAGLAAAGALPGPLDFLTTSSSDDVVEEQGAPDDDADDSAGALDEDDTDGSVDDVEGSDSDGPDEEASETAKNVHEAQRLADELGDDAPPCAHGKYVSAAARGDWDPVTDPEGAPAFEDMPCFHEDASETESSLDDADDEGDDEAEEEGEDEGPPAHAQAKGHGKDRSGRGGVED